MYVYEGLAIASAGFILPGPNVPCIVLFFCNMSRSSFCLGADEVVISALSSIEV